jgi:parvulin-like peptidyl-prolyl isomerase
MPETFAPRRAHRWRLGLLAVLLLLATLVAAGCGSSDDPSGLTVGSTGIATTTINDELEAIAKNEVIASQSAVGGRIRPEIAASWLTTDVQMAVAQQAVRKAGGRVTDQDRTRAREYADGHFGAPAAFAAFPDWFRRRVLAAYAFVPAYVRMHTEPPTEEQMRAAYDASIAGNCASKRFVSRIVTRDEAAARAAASEIAAGAAFADVARRVSTDTTTRSRGGAMGCLDGQQVDPAVQQVADATPLGTVSAPFAASPGWQILTVEDVGQVLAYDRVKPEIRRTLRYGEAGRTALRRAMAAARVEIDPRFGRWVVRDGEGRVEPPRSAATTTSRPGEPSTTTTTRAP